MKNIVHAYTAGVIDGEGTITLSRLPNREFRYPCVSVSSTTIEILDFLKENYGGTVSHHKTYQKHHKQSWSWKIMNRNAINLLTDIQDLLLDPIKSFRASLITTNYIALTPRNGKYTLEQRTKKLAFEQEFFHPSDTLVNNFNHE